MHPEIIRNEPGACPVCGMFLVPLITSKVEEEDTTYKKLLHKFIIASIFTAPIFIITMVEMIHNNPLFKIMELKYWNWMQLVLSIPVVFYATWMFFQRAARSIVTWNLNMFTLIGIGQFLDNVVELVEARVPEPAVSLDPRRLFLQPAQAELAGPHAPDLLRGDEPRLLTWGAADVV